MKNPRLFTALAVAVFSSALTILVAADAPAPAADKIAYHVVVDVTVDEEGNPESGAIVSSEDRTGEKLLDQYAIRQAAEIVKNQHMAPHEKEGHKVKFKVRVPINFAIDNDEGEATQHGPYPSIHTFDQPVYPVELYKKGVVGGVIVELTIGEDGRIHDPKVLKSSAPEFTDAVMAVLPKAVFTPAKNGDQPVATRWRLAFPFYTPENPAPLEWRVPPRPTLGSFAIVRAAVPAPSAAPAEPAPNATPAPAPAPGK